MNETLIPGSFPQIEAALIGEARKLLEEGIHPNEVYNQYALALSSLSELLSRQSLSGARRIDPCVGLRNLLRENGWNENEASSPLGAADWGP